MYVVFVLNQSPHSTRTKLRTNPQHQHLQVSTRIHLNIPTIQLTFHRREASTKSTRTNVPNEPQKNKTKQKTCYPLRRYEYGEFSNGNISGTCVSKEYPLPLFIFATFRESGGNLGVGLACCNQMNKICPDDGSSFCCVPTPDLT